MIKNKKGKISFFKLVSKYTKSKRQGSEGRRIDHEGVFRLNVDDSKSITLAIVLKNRDFIKKR
jgi:hypothetical protein